jgi:DNA polymerase III epsilon subunit-like protein
MKIVSIDVETTGLDPERNQILSIGAIIEDTTKKLSFEEIPKFNAIILHHELTGSPRAITMNKELISLMGEYLEGDKGVRKKHDEHSGFQFLRPEDVAQEFFDFLWENGLGYDFGGLGSRIKNGKSCPMFNSSTKSILINVAGKNFGTFDKLFLEKLPWWKKLIQPKQRVIDPAILCCDWNIDVALPSLTQCKERLDIKGLVTHNALKDAWDVIQVLRKFY